MIVKIGYKIVTFYVDEERNTVEIHLEWISEGISSEISSRIEPSTQDLARIWDIPYSNTYSLSSAYRNDWRRIFALYKEKYGEYPTIDVFKNALQQLVAEAKGKLLALKESGKLAINVEYHNGIDLNLGLSEETIEAPGQTLLITPNGQIYQISMISQGDLKEFIREQAKTTVRTLYAALEQLKKDEEEDLMMRIPNSLIINTPIIKTIVTADHVFWVLTAPFRIMRVIHENRHYFVNDEMAEELQLPYYLPALAKRRDNGKVFFTLLDAATLNIATVKHPNGYRDGTVCVSMSPPTALDPDTLHAALMQLHEAFIVANLDSPANHDVVAKNLEEAIINNKLPEVTPWIRAMGGDNSGG